MIDLLLGASLAFLLVRGWFRGFVREAMDLVGLVVGIVLAFRFSPALGSAINGMWGVSEDLARFGAGLVLFLGVGIGAAFAARSLERKARVPGLNLVNRAWGAGLAFAWGVFVAILLLSLLTVLPVPGVVASQIDDSTVAGTLTDPAGMPQQVFSRLSGDDLVQTLLNLRHAAGSRQVVLDEGESLSFPPAERGALEEDDAAAADLYARLNQARIDSGVAPLAWSPALAEIATTHAIDMYRSGVFAHRSAATGVVADRLDAAGVRYVVAGENLAIATTTGEIHRGLMESDGHRANIVHREFRRVGIAVVDGPLGLIAVQVFTG